MPLTVTEKEHWRQRIAAKVERRIEALAAGDPGLIDRIAAPLLKASGAAAPRACVEAVRAAVTMPMDEGLANERRLLAGLTEPERQQLQALLGKLNLPL